MRHILHLATSMGMPCQRRLTTACQPGSEHVAASGMASDKFGLLHLPLTWRFKIALRLRAVQMPGISSSCVCYSIVQGSAWGIQQRIECVRVAVPEFDPIAVSAAKQNAALLNAAQKKLGKMLASLYVSMPSLAACGFKASFAKHSMALTQQRTSSSHAGRGTQGHDASAAAVAAVAPAIGLDMAALQELISSSRDALTKVSN